MTYLEFLGIFLVPPIAGLLILERGRVPLRLAGQLGALVVVAVVYTAPWDRELITESVWTYPAAQVAGATILRVPVEEYAFYALQVVLAGLVTASLLRRRGARR